MITLSFCAIVKNEAENLARCLASVKPYVDELIIVDTGSTDETIAIAQQYGAKVGHFEWCDDFAAARNYALSLISGEWVLTLDADEELRISDSNWRHQLLQDNEAIAYTLELKEIEADTSQFRTIRIFQNLPNLTYVGRYHESLYYQNQLLCLDHPQVGALNGVSAIHYGYTKEQLSAKAKPRILMLERIRDEDELSLPLLWTLAGKYQTSEADSQYQDCCNEALDRLSPHIISGEAPEDSRTVRSWLYCLGFQRLVDEDLETTRLICQCGSAWFPDYPPLTYLNGLCLRFLGFPRGTIPYFELCIQSGNIGNYFKGEPFHPDLITRDPAYELGLAHLNLRQFQDAITAFTLALSFDPNFTAAQEQLAITRSLYSKT
jgi:glycosyltransferase involved in cell wall biosynthesis